MKKSPQNCICQNCKQPFVPAPQARNRQRFCGKPKCRKASQDWSYLCWLARNPDAYKTVKARLRVLKWRKAHPGYSRRRVAVAKTKPAAQDVPVSIPNQASVPAPNRAPLPNTLPNLDPHNPLIFGIIAHLFGCNTHNEIVRQIRKLICKGLEIQGMTPGNQMYGTNAMTHETNAAPGGEPARGPGKAGHPTQAKARSGAPGGHAVPTPKPSEVHPA